MKIKPYAILSLICIVATGCIDASGGNPYPSYPSGGGYNNGGYYGNSYDRDRYEYERAREERRKLRDERERIEDERERLAAEQRRQEHARTPPPPKEQCPPGFRVNTGGRCTDKERKNGCRDIRMPGGLTCIDK